MTTGTYTLVIPSVQFSDAGTYRCRDEDGRGEHVDANLHITEITDLRLMPEYAEAQVGERVQLNCTTYYKTEPVNWQHIPLGKSLPVDVYFSGNFRNNYTTGYDAQTDKETGINSLIIMKVNFGDGGLFRCIEKQGRGQHKEANLTVIVGAKIIVGPINTVVLVNNRAELTCRTSYNYFVSQWWFTEVGSTSAKLLYSRERNVDENFSRVEVSLSSGGLCTLAINNTQLEDAGIYICKIHIERIGGSIGIIKESAQLIILNDINSCKTNTSTSAAEGVVLEMRCSISYRGNWAPTTEWRETEEDERVVTDGVEAFIFTNANITSTLKLLANSTMNGKRYIFRAFFTKYIGETNMNATNVPNNTYFWSSPTLNITYGPKDLRITPQLSSYKIGDELTCSADANPAPTYEWIDVYTRVISDGAVFRLKEGIFVQEQFTLACKATNAVSSMNKQINLTIERHEQSMESSASLYLLALVPTPVLLMILVVVVYRHLRLKRLATLQLDQPGPSKMNEEANISLPDEAPGEDSFNTGPDSTGSYTSIPSVENEGQIVQEKPSIVEESTEENSTEDLANSVGYSELEPREISAPTFYNRLLKSSLQSQANIAIAMFPKKNDYVNVPIATEQSNLYLSLED